MVPRWLQPQLNSQSGRRSILYWCPGMSAIPRLAQLVCIVTGYCLCCHKNLRAYTSGDDGAASVTQAAAVHVVPIYDLGTAFSFPFKPQTVIL